MQPLSPSLRRVIGTTALITLTYLLSIVLASPLQLILALYGVTLIATIWMVIRILKDPFSTDKTFDEYFYLDREDLRRNGDE